MCNAAPSDATLVSDEDFRLLEKYRSRPRQLARWLLESRNRLRAKYRCVKVELKRLKVRVSDLAKSRENWRQRAEASEQQLLVMKTEVERLAALLEQQSPDSGSSKKK
jgi:hypothetical protein